jgi:hypothetical protein
MKAFALPATTVALLLSMSGAALAQYNPSAAENAPMERVSVPYKAKSGKVEYREETRHVTSDTFGNAAGNKHDLAIDGAFEGQTIAVLHLYTGFDFNLPKEALKEKGFSVYRWVGNPPSPEDLRAGLAKSCQLWIISDETQKLNGEHLKVIKEFFNSGKGVYIWGDNEPYYADANFVAQGLFGGKMLGNLQGDQVVGLQNDAGKKGLLRRHLLSTGLEYIYEGVTIATIQPNDALKPLIHGSANNLVAAYYDNGGKRAILDGGFTRLYNKWDTAGTGRYVKNAAAWLVNYERFGDAVVANKTPTSKDESRPVKQ